LFFIIECGAGRAGKLRRDRNRTGAGDYLMASKRKLWARSLCMELFQTIIQ